MTKKTCTSTLRRCLKELIVKGKARALEIANHFQTENPFFTFVLQASYTSAKCYFEVYSSNVQDDRILFIPMCHVILQDLLSGAFDNLFSHYVFVSFYILADYTN